MSTLSLTTASVSSSYPINLLPILSPQATSLSSLYFFLSIFSVSSLAPPSSYTNICPSFVQVSFSIPLYESSTFPANSSFPPIWSLFSLLFSIWICHFPLFTLWQPQQSPFVLPNCSSSCSPFCQLLGLIDQYRRQWLCNCYWPESAHTIMNLYSRRSQHNPFRSTL